MVDPFTLSLIGGGIGALTSKKPLKGALLGAGMGYGGGLLAGGGTAGGLLGNPMTAATYGTGLGTQQTAMLAAQDSGMGPMMGGGLFGDVSKFAKDAAPVMNAVSTGMSLMGPGQDQPVQTPPPMVGQGGPQGLTGLLQSIQQGQQAQMQADEQKRAARRAALRGGLL